MSYLAGKLIGALLDLDRDLFVNREPGRLSDCSYFFDDMYTFFVQALPKVKGFL